MPVEPGKSLVAPRLLNWYPVARISGFNRLTSMLTFELVAPGNSSGVVTIEVPLEMTVIVMTSARAWPARRPRAVLNAKDRIFPRGGIIAVNTPFA